MGGLLLKELLPSPLCRPWKVASPPSQGSAEEDTKWGSQFRIIVVKAGCAAQMCLVHISLCGSAWKAFSFFSFFSFCDILFPLLGYLFRSSLCGLWACMDPQVSFPKSLQLLLSPPLALGI